MATGRGNLLTKQVDEYLVAAEVCRRSSYCDQLHRCGRQVVR
jgi:hypothetical protein